MPSLYGLKWRSHLARERLRRRRDLRRLRAQGVEIGAGSWLASGSQIRRGTVIGHHTKINGPASVRGSARATIGPYCAIGMRFTIITSNHATHLPHMQVMLNRQLRLPKMDVPGDVSIGPTCWVGDDVTVLRGVTVGVGAVLANGSVVTRDVPDFTVAAGVPAKPVRRRCSEQVAEVLLEAAWWDWPRERMERNREFFSTDIGEVSPQALRAMIRD